MPDLKDLNTSRQEVVEKGSSRRVHETIQRMRRDTPDFRD